MTEIQSPTVGGAAWQCAFFYGVLFMVSLILYPTLENLLSDPLALFVLAGMQVLAVGVASFLATRFYDRGFIEGRARAGGLSLVMRYGVTLAVPMVGLPMLIVLGQSNSVAGGMVAFAVGFIGLVVAPVIIILGVPVGVMLARCLSARDGGTLS